MTRDTSAAGGTSTAESASGPTIPPTSTPTPRPDVAAMGAPSGRGCGSWATGSTTRPARPAPTTARSRSRCRSPRERHRTDHGPHPVASTEREWGRVDDRAVAVPGRGGRAHTRPGPGVRRRHALAQLVPFTPWVALVALVVLLLSLSRRRWVLSVIAGLLVVAHGVWLVPFFVPGPGIAPGGDGTLRVMATNVLYGQADAQAVVVAVREEKVELLSVLELSEEFAAELVAAGIEDELPYSWTTIHPTEGAAGSGLWSATPLSDEREGVASRFHQPSAVVGLDGTSVRVTAVHPYPPTPGAVDLWTGTSRCCATRCTRTPCHRSCSATSTRPSTTPRSATCSASGSPTRPGSRGGREPLVAAGRRFPPLVDLDHVVVDEGMRVDDVRSVAIPGTDHLAIVATVQVRP
ncbi:hypothetical protein NKG05_08835 [Oerskovia sp. M15]